MAGVIVGQGNVGGDTFSFAQPFVVDKEEGVILDDRSSERGAELVAFVSGFAERIEVISGV